jgi:hypothetical protein
MQHCLTLNSTYRSYRQKICDTRQSSSAEDRLQEETEMTKSKQQMRELADKELDAVSGGGFISTGNVWAHQKNVAVVKYSFFTEIGQSNNINTGYQG